MTTELLDKKVLVEKYLQETRACLSPFSFTNIFAWQDFCKFKFRMISDNLCVFARDSAGTFLYLPPLGRHVTGDTMMACFDVMRSANSGNGVSRVENVPQELLPLFPEDKFDHYKKGYEYCYWRPDIAAFKGNAYKSQRWMYNYFTSRYAYEYLPFASEMLADCLALYRCWSRQRRPSEKDPVALQMLEENETVHRLIMSHYEDLGLVGRVVLVNHQVRAYTFGYALGDKMFCVLLEITDLNIKGLAAFIFREFCSDDGLKNYAFINVMDDLGLERLGEGKLSYHPSVMLPSYVITEK